MCLVGNIMAKKVLALVGELNTTYIGTVIECSKLITWAYVKLVIRQGSLKKNHISNSSFRASPPYYSVLLFSLDFATNAIPEVGKVNYAFRIAPPDLIATTIGVASVFTYTVGKG